MVGDGRGCTCDVEKGWTARGMEGDVGYGGVFHNSYHRN